MTIKLNRCQFVAASAGTGSFVYDETEEGFKGPVGSANGTYGYIAESSFNSSGVATQYENGVGTWNDATHTLTRTPVTSSNGNLAVDFTDPPKVRMGVPLAADWPVVRSLVEGSNISIDATDPENPVVSASGGGGGGALSDLSDVELTDLQPDNQIFWNGTKWVNGYAILDILEGSNIAVDKSTPTLPVIGTVGFTGTFQTGDALTVTVQDGVITDVS